MGNGREVVVVGAVRTAIGSYGGSLKDKSPTELGAAVVAEAIKRAGIEPADVQHVGFGNVIHTDPKDHYLGRVVAVKGGIPDTTPGFTVNRLCGSGMEAIVSIAQRILLGDCDVGIGGGAECMSRGQYWVPGLRWGQRMWDAQVVDAMVGALTDPFEEYHMGITAENIAEKYTISREDQDRLAASSHQRATHAIEQGYFKEQILPIEIRVKKETKMYDTDEFVRRDATVEGLAKLRPVFKKEGGTVTAGNASGINDAAAAVVLMERSVAEQRGLKPMARLVAYGHGGVDHKIMGMGPVPAVRNVLEKSGLSLDDMDLIELNEAFAAQALGVIRELGLPEDKPNPNGSGISLGHPIGATGAILAVKTVYELQRTGGRYGLATMCIGGGQGVAAIFERI
jgi:acetyl-CoA C-acetyltransferase